MAAPRMTLDSGFRRNDGKGVGTNGMTGGSWADLNDGREGVGTHFSDGEAMRDRGP